MSRKKSNYMQNVLSNLEINKYIILKCDIKANTEFLKNSYKNEQIFSFACFFKNILCQALGGEEKYQFTECEQHISNFMPQNIKRYSYNINEIFKIFPNKIKLLVKSFCFIVMPHSQSFKISQHMKNSDLLHCVDFLIHNNKDAEKNRIITKISEKVNNLTSGFMNYKLKKDFLNNDNRIYISILYFKGTWLYSFRTCPNHRKFQNFNGEKKMRKYIQSYDNNIEYKKFNIGSEKDVEAFILPFQSAEKGRFKAIYICPNFFPYDPMDLVKSYEQFIIEFTKQTNENFGIKKSKFDLINANILIPEFDQTCENLDLIKLLPETYQGGPALETKSFMKIRVKIDEKGLEGAAVCSTICTFSIKSPKPTINIEIDKPYIILVYDDKMQQTLFTVKDNGYDSED